jgi:hypothetical protein
MNSPKRTRKRNLQILFIALALVSITAVVLIVLLERKINSHSFDEQRYQKEEERFEKVLQQASDEELLLVLKFAIIHHHVPNTWNIDPYMDVTVGVGEWNRSLKVYDKLKARADLLQQIYPDLKVLDDYITINTLVWPFTDTIAAQTILHNAQKDNGRDVDSLMNAGTRRSSLEYKYFGTPLLRY